MALHYCSLASGSSGNCHFVRSNDTRILLDVGLSARATKNALEKIGENIEEVDAILITHEHIDHIKGLPVLMRKYNLPVMISKITYDAIESKLEKVDPSLISFIDGNRITIKDIVVDPFKIYHDAADPYGYSFSFDNKKLSILTDVGEIDDGIYESIMDSDFLVIEANHDVNMVNFGPYPYPLKRRILGQYGHLSNEHAGRTVAKMFAGGRLKSVVLAHLSKDNNFPELAYLTVKNILEEQNIIIGQDINLELTYRDKISKYFRIV